LGFLVGVMVGVVGTVTAAVVERKSVRVLAGEARRKVREFRNVVVHIDLSESLRKSSDDARTRVTGFLTGVRKHNVPTVVIVDDAAFADEDTVEVVEELLAREAPVLVVATVRPDPFESQIQTRTGFGRVIHAFGSASKTQRFQLEALTDEAMIEIVLSRAPATDRSVAAAIARHASGNPLVLRQHLEEPVIARSLVDGAYRLGNPAGVVAKLPTDPQGNFERYWEQLPDDVRQLLGIASLHGLLIQPDSVCIGYQAAFEADDAELLISCNPTSEPVRLGPPERRRAPGAVEATRDRCRRGSRAGRRGGGSIRARARRTQRRAARSVDRGQVRRACDCVGGLGW
jgi:hypothetical protein